MQRHGKTARWRWVIGGIAAAAALGACMREEPAREDARDKAATLKVPFEANAGQWPQEVAFSARHFAGALFVTDAGEIVHALRGPVREEGERGDGFALVERFGNGGEAIPRAQEISSARVSYFLGNDPSRWQSDVATFEGISLGDVWPGVEVRLLARAHTIEKLFFLRPGAEVGSIAMELAGALSHRVAEDGRLLVETPHGDIAFSAPVAFQDVDGERRDVPVHYAMREGGYGFVVGAYDPRHTLVIDPVLHSTYLGGGGEDTPQGVALADDGSVIVVTESRSVDFPGVSGGAFEEADGGIDFVVSRLSADLSTLLQSTYLGGAAADYPNGVLVHDGDVFVFGTSNSGDFPIPEGAAQPLHGGSSDGVVARLDATLTTLKAATFLGGTGGDSKYSMVARGDSLWLAGQTFGETWPTTPGVVQPSSAGGTDYIISRVTTDLSTLEASTYLGGGNYEYFGYLALAPDGDIFLLGQSASGAMPGTAGGAQPNSGGEVDFFVSRLSPDLQTLRQSTYLGGPGDDMARAIVVSEEGDVIVVGDVVGNTDFPGTEGGAQPENGGDNEIVVARLSGDLKTLVQSTFLGTDQWESAFALALDTQGYVLVGGETYSHEFPAIEGAAQRYYGGKYDAVIARFDPGLTTLVQSTYLGGADKDAVFGLAVDGPEVIAAVVTVSNNFPMVGGGAASDASGSRDAAIVRLTADLREEPLCDDLFHGGVPCEAEAVCGDGVLDPNEGCDDGNTEAGDGCGETCGIEPGFTCSGEPSVCAAEVPDDDDDDDDDGASVAPDGCACGATGPGGAGGLLSLLGLALFWQAARRRRR